MRIEAVLRDELDENALTVREVLGGALASIVALFVASGDSDEAILTMVRKLIDIARTSEA